MRRNSNSAREDYGMVSHVEIVAALPLLPKQSKYQLDLEINNHMRCLEGRQRIFGLIGGILEWLGGRVLEGLAKRGCACGSVQGTSAKLQEDHCIHAQKVVYATTWDFPGVG